MTNTANPRGTPRASAVRPTPEALAGDPLPMGDPMLEGRTVPEPRPGLDHRSDSRSVPELLADLARSIPALVRQETQLLRSELSDKVTKIEMGLGSMAAGGILLFAALLVLMQAIVIALTGLVGPGWASLIVGIAAAAIGAVLLKKGADQMKASNLMPERTAHQLKQDAELAKEQVR